MVIDSFEFLQELYRGFPPDPTTFITLTAIHPNGIYPAISRHIPLGNQRALYHALECLKNANNLGWGAYYGVAPRRPSLGRLKRGGKKDVSAMPALCVDIDIYTDKTLQALQHFYPLPSAIVSSGHGIHVYWFLELPSSELNSADMLLKGLAQWWGGDILSVAQSMRLPGTINTKQCRSNVRCECIYWYPNRRWRLEQFAPYMFSNGRTIPMRQFESLSGKQVGDWLIHKHEGFVKSNGWIAALCPFGHSSDYPGKHFNWNPNLRIGYCFGRHGKIKSSEIGLISLTAP
jgi:hypothetical protein